MNKQLQTAINSLRFGIGYSLDLNNKTVYFTRSYREPQKIQTYCVESFEGEPIQELWDHEWEEGPVKMGKSKVEALREHLHKQL